MFLSKSFNRNRGRLLAAPLAEGRPPDVAVLPQPGLLRRYAREGLLLPLDERVGEVVA